MTPLAYSTQTTERASASDRSPDYALDHAKIEVAAFSVWFGDEQVLFDIDLLIPERSVTAVIGPAGAGKSTFLRALNRMNEPIERTRHCGMVRLNGRDVSRWDPAELRRHVGMVFQKANPFPRTIFDNVAFGPRVAGIRNPVQLAAAVESSLRRAALWDELRDRLAAPAHQLSPGQQQRLCIARALATNPEVLLLDEPTAGLDPRSTSQIEDLVFELRLERTVLLATNSLQQAARVSDRTAFFCGGRLIESGLTRQVFTLPRARQTEDYLTGRIG